MPHKFLCLCLLGLFLTTGCAVKAPVPSEEKPAASRLEQHAAQAWHNEAYERSLRLYHELVQTQDLSAPSAAEAWRRIAQSAVALERFDLALKGLHRWAQSDPRAQSRWPWHDVYSFTLGQTQGAKKANAYLRTLVLEDETSWQVRQPAGERLTRIYWQQEAFTDFARVQAALHRAAPTKDAQLRIEAFLRRTVQDAPDDTWQALLQQIGPLTAQKYPDNLLQWIRTIEQLEAGTLEWGAAWHRLAAVVRQGGLAQTKRLEEHLQALREDYGAPKQEIALLLPLDGAYAKFGHGILRGAGAAQWEITRNGGSITVHILNTAAENWAKRLRALPENIQLVGGPLRHGVWDSLPEKRRNNRAFFTFLPSLSEGEEGQSAWRFFASTEDQSRALVQACNELDIHDIAVLYPRETFGRRMAESFWEQTRNRNATITGLQGYSPDTPTQWSSTVADFLRVPEEKPQSAEAEDDASEQRPEPNFEAVFVPDTLSKAQLMVPNFFYHDEDRLLFLGPRLWSQALAQGEDLEDRYFRLALTPAAWDPGSQRPGVVRLRRELDRAGLPDPDFWTALGYDFVRFAARLDDPTPGVNPTALNRRLHDFSGLSWALAPLQWDPNGRARQELFLFQPVSGGLRPAALDTLHNRLEKTRREHARRNAPKNATAPAPEEDIPTQADE